jgi:predicted Zn-dependent protease
MNDRGESAGLAQVRTDPDRDSVHRRRARLVACLVGSVAVISAVAAGRELAVRADVRAARESVAAGRLDEASAWLGRWLRARPDAAEAHYLMARVAWARDRGDEAEAELQRARALGYDPKALDRLRALHLARSGRTAEAEPILVRTLESSRAPDPEAAEALARILLETGRPRPAAIVLDRWRRDAPGDARPYLWLTEVDRRTSAGPAAAVEHYRAALQRDPTLDKARLGLAEALRASHRADEARPEYKVYLARHPDDAAGLVGAALNALEAGDLDAADRHLARALELAPANPEALKARAGLDLRRGDARDALQHLDAALRADPFDAEAVYNRGLAQARLGRDGEAKAEQERAGRLKREQAELVKIQRSLDSEPSNLGLRLQIARWMFDHGRDDQGVRWAKTILAIDPGHAGANGLLAEYHRRRGEAGLSNYFSLQAAPGASRAR